MILTWRVRVAVSLALGCWHWQSRTRIWTQLESLPSLRLSLPAESLADFQTCEQLEPCESRCHWLCHCATPGLPVVKPLRLVTTQAESLTRASS